MEKLYNNIVMPENFDSADAENIPYGTRLFFS